MRILISILFFCFFYVVHGQQLNASMHIQNALYFQKEALKGDLDFHSGIRPYLINEIQKDSLNLIDYDSSFMKKEVRLTLGNFNSSKKVKFEFYPLFNISAGVEHHNHLGTKFVYDLGAGVGFRSNFGKKLSIELNYRYDLASYTFAEDSVASNFGVISGSKIDKFSGIHRSSHFIRGNLSYSPSKYFNFRLGYGRHFIGEGYRSMFLSDDGNPYPYLNIQTKVWRIKYINIFAWQRDFQGSNYASLKPRNKFSSTHYLSLNAFKGFNIGIFETVIWQDKDTLINRGFDIRYLNPIIFFRPVEYATGSADNVILGASISYRFLEKYQFYYQWSIDEFLLKEIRANNGWWANKFGMQGGFKAFEPFNWKGLYFQIEFNWVRPFTYAHINSMQANANQNLPLAHIKGANFHEILMRVNKSWGRLNLYTFLLYNQYGADQDTASYGGNILRSYEDRSFEYGNKTGQGLKNNLFLARVSLNYLLFPESALTLELGYEFRYNQNELRTDLSNYVFISFKSNLWNRNRDY
ncbi:MAG: hypothetical protein KDC84_03320 [Crocinitomicaceae bacterium]|nr:hypothetical protein [Crocinitomicaceae bacterium]